MRPPLRFHWFVLLISCTARCAGSRPSVVHLTHPARQPERGQEVVGRPGGGVLLEQRVLAHRGRAVRVLGRDPGPLGEGAEEQLTTHVVEFGPENAHGREGSLHLLALERVVVDEDGGVGSDVELGQDLADRDRLGAEVDAHDVEVVQAQRAAERHLRVVPQDAVPVRPDVGLVVLARNGEEDTAFLAGS